MAILNINGTDTPDPASFSVALQDIDSDNTTRDETGQMHRDRVRQGVRKASGKWTFKTNADAQLLLNLVSPDAVTATMLDPQDGGQRTGTFYVGDRSCDLVHTGLGLRWTVSFDLVEY